MKTGVLFSSTHFLLFAGCIFRLAFFFLGSFFSSNTVTCAMAALSVPIPSGVLALMPTAPGLIRNNSATRAWMRLACGPILGSARINVESTLAIA